MILGTSLLGHLREALEGLIEEVLPTPVLDYPSVVRYFVENRPDDPRVRAGALIRSRGFFQTRILQVFLDEKRQPVCDLDGRPQGRILIVSRVDEELEELFDGGDLILVE